MSNAQRKRLTELYCLLNALSEMSPDNPMDIGRVASASRASKMAGRSMAWAVLEMRDGNWEGADTHLIDAREAIIREGGRP